MRQHPIERRLRRFRLWTGMFWTSLFAGWLVFANSFGGWMSFVLFAVGIGAVSVCLRFTDGRKRDIELGPVVFSGEVQVRGSHRVVTGRLSARVRLLVGRETIATRVAVLPHVLGKMIGWDYTLRAADFKVETVRTGPLSRAVGTLTFSPSWGPGRCIWDTSVVLSGPYGRGWLELQFFRSRTATPEGVQRELIQAGVQRTDDAMSRNADQCHPEISDR